MSKIAFIYPGQGAQVCGMGQDFCEQTKAGKETFDLASEIPWLLGSIPKISSFRTAFLPVSFPETL